ncbi:hypothetical protein ACWD01_36630 [Streptomyces sp. NPDC002835]
MARVYTRAFLADVHDWFALDRTAGQATAPHLSAEKDTLRRMFVCSRRRRGRRRGSLGLINERAAEIRSDEPEELFPRTGCRFKRVEPRQWMRDTSAARSARSAEGPPGNWVWTSTNQAPRATLS